MINLLLTMLGYCFLFLVFTYSWSLLVCYEYNPLTFSCLCGQTDDDRQLLFLYDRGKKKLMEGNRVAFTGNSDEISPTPHFDDVICFHISL